MIIKLIMHLHCKNAPPSKNPIGPGVIARRGCRTTAFSLVEVTIALGILAFAIIPMIGLVSVGMKTLRSSMDVTVQIDVVRKTVGEATRIPFTDLTATFDNQLFYFDDEGIQQTSSNAQTIFVARAAVNAPPSLLTSNTNIARLLEVTVHHFGDTNNQTVYSQLIVNTAQ